MDQRIRWSMSSSKTVRDLDEVKIYTRLDATAAPDALVSAVYTVRGRKYQDVRVGLEA